MNIDGVQNPDEIIFFEWGYAKINLTIALTWGIMLLLAGTSWLATRKLSPEMRLSRWQNLLEVIVVGLKQQITEVTKQKADRYLPLIGTFFLYILICNILSILPEIFMYLPPTSSLSTTTALALIVMVAVPVYGVSSIGVKEYIKEYLQPTPVMLPFNIVGELSRTLALAVRLYGNIMSGTMIGLVILGLAPLFFPIPMKALGLLSAVIQAYIFAVLALVYIASAVREPAAEPEEETVAETEAA